MAALPLLMVAALAPEPRFSRLKSSFRNMAQQINYWKLVIWKSCSGSLMVILTGMPALVLTWDMMTAPIRLLGICGLVGGVIKFLDGFFDQTYSRLAQGKPPIALPGINGNGNSESHTEVTIKADTVTTPKP